MFSLENYKYKNLTSSGFSHLSMLLFLTVVVGEVSCSNYVVCFVAVLVGE